MAAAQDQDDLEAEWEERTRPSRDAPRVKSLYLRKDYAAACPEQHLAYLHCLKAAKSWVPQSVNVCNEEYRAFAICKHRAKAVNGPDEDDGPQPSLASKLWQDLQREPFFIAAKMGAQEWLQRLGLSSPDSSSEGAGDSSSSSSSSTATSQPSS